MPTPSMLQAATSHNWVSSMDATQSVLKPSVDPQLIQRYGDQNMTGFMEMQGSMNPVSALQYDHFESDWLHSIVKVTGQGAAAANAAVTFTVAASPAYTYTYPSTAQAPYISVGPSSTATTTNPVGVQDIIQFPDGTQALVTARTTTTFTCYPTVLGTNIPATTTNVTEIAIIGNAHAEGSVQPASRNSRLNRYRNNMQIFKRTHETTGSAMGEQIWVEVEGTNGQKGYLWYYKGQLDEFKRMKNEREVSLLVGNKLTNTTLANIATPDESTTITTEGLIPFITNYGNITTYSLVTGILLADFEIMIATQLDKNRGAKENTMWCGISLSQGIDRFMRAEMKNGAISYGAFQGSKEKAISFNFSSFELTGYTFHKKTYDVFNYPQMLGALGQPYSTMGLIIPADNVVTSLGPNKTKVSVPSLRINYLSQKSAGGSYNRDWEEFMTGGANGIYTNSTDSIQYNLRSHVGFEGFAPNRFCQLVGA